MSFGNCFACGAETGGLDVCSACDLPQTEAVARLHAQAESARGRSEFLRTVTGVGIVLALAVGVGLSVAVTTPRSEIVAESRGYEAAMKEPMPVDLVNDLFLRTVDEKVHLGLRGWTSVQGKGGRTLVLEMNPPTGAKPSLWAALSDAERREIMQFIGAAYTVSLVRTGNPPDIAAAGHPDIVLRYYGIPGALARRPPSGEVEIYPSPVRPAAP